ncbi:MAG TPA: AAA family ATPase, partial [Kofleriaceae bacterium]|nr:AAA family ATPase [Kofleriaceae bacterium]
MKLTIRNLGRLTSATIDLDAEFTVFTGRNNTSKTYVAHVIYGFYRFAREYISQFIRADLQQGLRFPRWEYDLGPTIEKLDDLTNGIASHLQSRLPSIFATSPEFFAHTEIHLTCDDADRHRIKQRVLDYSGNLFYSLGESDTWESSKRSESSTVVFQRISASIVEPRSAREATPEYIDQAQLLFSIGITEVIAYAVVPRSHLPFVLSTERSAIQLFFRELFANRSAMVDAVLEEPKPDAVSQLQAKARLYPLVIRDGLRVAVQTQPTARRAQQQTEFAPLAEKLERLIGGEVRVAASNELTFVPTGSDLALDLQLASSSVKSLAALVYFLRTQARAGGLLLIDEPELNLHPDNQRRLTRILAELVRQGVSVLITTHSDYVLREL